MLLATNKEKPRDILQENMEIMLNMKSAEENLHLHEVVTTYEMFKKEEEKAGSEVGSEFNPKTQMPRDIITHYVVMKPLKTDVNHFVI